MTVPEATLGVRISSSQPPRPIGVAVMIGAKVLAVVSISEMRRVASQIDHMEVAAEHVDEE